MDLHSVQRVHRLLSGCVPGRVEGRDQGDDQRRDGQPDHAAGIEFGVQRRADGNLLDKSLLPNKIIVSLGSRRDVVGISKVHKAM